jgi:dipeptidyl aminopeptidase/acylaminoacyl peptidase
MHIPRVASCLLVLATAVQAQNRPATVDEVIKSEAFVAPSPQLTDAVLAPRYLNVTPSNFSPDRKWFINEIGDGPVTMETFSKPFHELGGLFVDYRANRNRNITIRTNVAIELRSATSNQKVSVALPPGLRVSNATWSPDGKAIAFLGHTVDATHIYVSDLAGKARQVTTRPVLATMVTSFDWTKGGSEIATVLIPEARSPMPVPPAVPQGPRVKLAEESDKNRLRTYQSLMATPHDQALLEWHATGQVALVDVNTKAVKKVGSPLMVRELDPSPDGRYLRVTRMNKPFSYLVPVQNFGATQEIWDTDGKVLAKIDDTPLNLGVDTARAVAAPGAGEGGANANGKREVTWRPDHQGLTYLEQEPAPARRDTSATPGDSTRRRKDRVMHWAPPFGPNDVKVLYESDTRIATHRYAPDLSVLFLSERTGPATHEYAVVLAEPGKKYTLARYRAEDVYSNPGTLVMARGTITAGGGFGGFGFGGGQGGGDRRVQLSPDGSSAYFAGTLYDRNPHEVGPRTFIDKVNIRSAQKSRLFLSENNSLFERAIAFQDLEAGQLVVMRESETSIPQAYARANGQLTQITENRDYTPDLTQAKKESFIVERPDGFKFKVNVTLPTDYTPGTRVPAMFWFYPREFAGQEEYDRGARTFNKNAFASFNPRSMQFLARAGYAVVEPDAPIVGPAGQWNNNYENDLRNNLAAVIDEVDKRGLVDRSRIGIGGHSYGAFSTVNAMAHTPFFKAGIAGDGNYNRTLTPLDFQSERRSLWDAKDTYLAMSPILHANNLTGALLMYHGMGDQNVGTELSNSPRLFHALNGLGKTTAMYLYPFEDHGPATRETLLDLWGRWSAWLDKYVKNPTKKDQTVS